MTSIKQKLTAKINFKWPQLGKDTKHSHTTRDFLNKTILGIVASRGLTQGEIALAQSIFGNSINYTTVNIVASKRILKGYGLSPNGNIYFNPQNWCIDFASQPLSDRAWFIHEMTHVWQFQQGMAVVRKALLNRKYSYHIKANKPFKHYGIEQQAQMVQDYYVLRERGQNCAQLGSCLPFLV